MSRIRGRDTTPEKRVRSLLHRLGFRFRLHVRIPLTRPSGSLSPIGGEGRSEGAEKLQILNWQFSIFNSATSLSPIGGEGRGEGARPPAKVRTRIPRAISVDILLPKYKTAIFVHGCFWHRHRGCKNCTTPTHRREWWQAKIEGKDAQTESAESPADNSPGQEK